MLFQIGFCDLAQKQNALAGSRGVTANAEAHLQVTARASLLEGQFFTPEGARAQFKAHMIEESSQLDAEITTRVMQDFQVYAREGGAAHATSSSSSSTQLSLPPAPLTSPARHPRRLHLNHAAMQDVQLDKQLWFVFLAGKLTRTF